MSGLFAIAYADEKDRRLRQEQEAAQEQRRVQEYNDGAIGRRLQNATAAKELAAMGVPPEQIAQLLGGGQDAMQVVSGIKTQLQQEQAQKKLLQQQQHIQTQQKLQGDIGAFIDQQIDNGIIDPSMINMAVQQTFGAGDEGAGKLAMDVAGGVLKNYGDLNAYKEERDAAKFNEFYGSIQNFPFEMQRELAKRKYPKMSQTITNAFSRKQTEQWLNSNGELMKLLSSMTPEDAAEAAAQSAAAYGVSISPDTINAMTAPYRAINQRQRWAEWLKRERDAKLTAAEKAGAKLKEQGDRIGGLTYDKALASVGIENISAQQAIGRLAQTTLIQDDATMNAIIEWVRDNPDTFPENAPTGTIQSRIVNAVKSGQIPGVRPDGVMLRDEYEKSLIMEGLESSGPPPRKWTELKSEYEDFPEIDTYIEGKLKKESRFGGKQEQLDKDWLTLVNKLQRTIDKKISDLTLIQGDAGTHELTRKDQQYIDQQLLKYENYRRDLIRYRMGGNPLPAKFADQ